MKTITLNKDKLIIRLIKALKYTSSNYKIMLHINGNYSDNEIELEIKEARRVLKFADKVGYKL